ncbi:docking protein 1 isoform X3 [Sparus aurata]|uniref:docking protein 1 isoform X3 n=1 Tax=Sparus aurata TaxID=8175 RepID=UPI0011C0F1DE|nr:docking protein 1-like isoform X3 [Sparus aurata]
MDSQIKTGKVYLRPHKAGKKWKPVLLSLFPHSSMGVGRVEIQDMAGGGAGADHGAGVRRHHQPHADRNVKVVRLSELISVLRLPPNAEACPLENMSAFCVETQDRTMVFAALKDDCVEWVEKLCHSTFQGSYWLQVGPESLLLKDIQKKNIVREWPYELLRRYGKDKLALTIEAGRRCDSGPGSFTFETQQADKIFSLIQSTIKRKTSTVTLSNQIQEADKVTITNNQVHSPLPKIPDATNMAANIGNKLRTQERKHPSSHESAPAPKGSSESISPQPAPITLMPLPLVPTHDSHSGGGQSEAVYADPADCIQSVPKPQLTMALYVDPASVLPLKPPSSINNPPPHVFTSNPCCNIKQLDSIYSEVYDKISPVGDKQSVTQFRGNTQCSVDDEPIYAEPMSKKEEESRKKESKPNPFAHLYAQVCKTTPSSSPSASNPPVTTSMSTTKATDQSLDDVMYENLGII